MGFYTTLDDGLYYQGGYNTATAGLRFQLITGMQASTLEGTQANEISLEVKCGRLLTDDGALLVQFGECGADATGMRAVRPTDDLYAYQQVARDFLTHLDYTYEPGGRDVFWQHLRKHIDIFANASLQAQATPRQPAGPNQLTAAQLAQLEKEYSEALQVRREAFRNTERAFYTQNQQARGAEPRESSRIKPLLQAQRLAGRSLGLFGRYIAPLFNVGHDDDVSVAVRQIDARYEYRQKVEIWGQYFDLGRALINLGVKIPTGSEHSSVIVTVERRPINSDGPWHLHAQWFTRNHGAKPGEGKMRLKRVCHFEDFPVTKGYYISGGECRGTWLIHHVCNDDTAYQIRSAHGIWTPVNRRGEGDCQLTHRWNPPNSCAVPW